MDWTSIVVALIAFLGGGGVTGLVTVILQRHWKKQDDANKITPARIGVIEAKIDALVKSQKVMSIDRIRYLGLCYIGAKGITLEEKETLHEMHDAYEALGGNGHLDTVMDEVDKLQVVESRFKKEAGK